jgi:Kef-type K+ transport system membrane component KefB
LRVTEGNSLPTPNPLPLEHGSLKTVLVVFGILLVAAVGSSKALGESRYPGIRLLAKTSLFFLVLGALIGPSGFQLIEPEVLKQMSPIVVIGLGWIGFLYGSTLEYRSLRKFRSQLFWTAFGEALVTFALVGLSCAILHRLGMLAWDPPAYLLLASTAACTAPLQRLMGTAADQEGATVRLAHFCSRLDDLPGILALGIIFSVTPPRIGDSALFSFLFWFTVQVVLGAVLGWVTDYLYHSIETADGKTDPGELTLVFFGMLCLSSGFAAYLQLSPLFVGVVMGMVFANHSEHAESLAGSLAEKEHTVFVLFLLVSGCNWPFRGFNAWLPLLVYLLVRIMGKVVGSFFSRRLFLSDEGQGDAHQASERFGLALVPQGGLAVAMVVSYMWSFSSSSAAWAINIVHISVIVNDLIAPYLLKRIEVTE